MIVTRWFALSPLVFAAACASRPLQPGAPKPLRGEDGPSGSIETMFTGGIINRQVTATFSVDEPAFVVIGHLGGDGTLRILYPSDPDQFAVTPARKRFRTTPFAAGYDGAPSLYSFAMAPYRSLGARFDSYDGRGYGYVFMVTSRVPMRFDTFSDGYDWFDLDVRDYFRTSDPRTAILEFAERLARGRHSVRFARSYTSLNLSGYADQAMDCAVLSSIDHRFLNGFWNSWGSYGLGVWLSPRNVAPYSDNYRHGCGPRHYASYHYYGETYRNRFTGVLTPYTPRPAANPPVGPITPVLTRPTERGFGERGVTVARSELTRNASGARNARTTFAQRNRSGDDGGGSVIGRRDQNRGTNDPPTFRGGARAASSQTHTASGGSSGGSSSQPAPAPRPAPTTSTQQPPSTTKVKN